MPAPQPEFIELKVLSPDFMGKFLEPTRRFVQGMMDRLSVSHWKYGSIHNTFPIQKRGVDNIELRVKKYLDTGNTEWLLDAANYCLIEYMRPSHPDAHFRSTDSDESPGAVLVDGSIIHGKPPELPLATRLRRREGD